MQYVLEGSVRRDADQVRITAQLIQMKDQSHLWSRRYDRELKSTLALQSEIAQQIAGEIQLALGRDKIRPGNGGAAARVDFVRGLRSVLAGALFLEQEDGGRL